MSTGQWDGEDVIGEEAGEYVMSMMKPSLKMPFGKPVCNSNAVITSLHIWIYPKLAFYVHGMREGMSKVIIRGT